MGGGEVKRPGPPLLSASLFLAAFMRREQVRPGEPYL